MAAGDWTWYGVGPNVDLSSGSYKVLLTTVTHTPNQDTHTVRTDITNEVTGTLYTAGGVAVTVTRTYDGPSNEIRAAVSNAVWGPGATITFRNAHLYKVIGTAATDLLIAYIAYAADQSVSNGTLTISNPSPTLKGTVAAQRRPDVAITRDNILGSGSNNGAAIVAMTTSAAAAAGSRICVAVSWFATAGTMAVSDTGGAYTSHVVNNNGSDHLAIFSRVIVGSLASGSAITATITGGASVGGVLLGAASYLATTALDTTASPAGTSGTAWSSGAATNAVADALFFGAAGNETVTTTSSTPVNGSEIADVWNSAAGQGLAINETIATTTASRTVSGTWVGASSTATTGGLAIFSGTAGAATVRRNRMPQTAVYRSTR